MNDDNSASAKRGWLARLLGSGDAQAIAAIEAELNQARTDLELAAQRLEGETARRETAEYDLGRLHTEHTARLAGHEAELAAVRFRAQGLAEQVEELKAKLEAEVRRAAHHEHERAGASARASAAEQARATAAARMVKLERDSLAQRESHAAELQRVVSERAQLQLERDALVAERELLLRERDRLRRASDQRAVDQARVERVQAETAVTLAHVVRLLDAALSALIAALGRRAAWAMAETSSAGEPVPAELVGVLGLEGDIRELLARVLTITAVRRRASGPDAAGVSE